MIKGVNKQILEVTNTENPYFEKIIFFVKPEYKNTDGKTIQREAEALASISQRPPKARIGKKRIIKIILNSALFTGAGVALSFIINTFV